MNHKRNFRDLNCVVLFEILSNFFFHFQNFTYRTSNQSHSVSIPNAVRLRMHFTFTFFLSKKKIISGRISTKLASFQIHFSFAIISQLFFPLSAGVNYSALTDKLNMKMTIMRLKYENKLDFERDLVCCLRQRDVKQ